MLIRTTKVPFVPMRIVVGLLLAITATSNAQPSVDSLAAITTRGRLLAAYDYAAWHGTDAIVPLVKDESLVRGYVARETSAGWVVSFGRLSSNADTFFVAFEAKQRAERPDSFTAVALTVPRPDTGYLLRAARAIELARSEPPPFKRSYNIAALPASNGEWWVYSMPAQVYANSWPLGGDTRYRVSADGRTVLARRRMHNTIIEVCIPTFKDMKLMASTHTAVLDTIPEDTDVFHVLARGFHAPEIVATDTFIYRIETDGSIRLVAHR